MIDAYTAGIILDRGHQLFYVVLTLDATEEDADSIAGAMRGRPRLRERLSHHSSTQRRQRLTWRRSWH